MPGRFALKPMLYKIWHAPDNIRILDPLPLMHRRGIIAGFLLVIIGFLLPAGGDSSDTAQVRRDAQLDLQSESQPQQQGNLQQPLPPITSTPTVSDPGQAAPTSPEVVQEGQPDDPMPQTQSQNAPPGIDQQWRSYRLESGKTLAQLFRDHNLPATDAYAMSQVEGSGKPLSSLQVGQMVKIRQNASGVVTGLTVDAGGQQVLFTRQSNGSFIRAR